jgi:hypothetical protein
MSLKLNLICKTNIIFYENISFAINNLDLKLQQNENDVLTASCSDNDYVNTFNTGDPAFDTAHKDFGIYPSNVNYSVNAANLIMPNIMSLQQ